MDGCNVQSNGCIAEKILSAQLVMMVGKKSLYSEIEGKYCSNLSHLDDSSIISSDQNFVQQWHYFVSLLGIWISWETKQIFPGLEFHT